MSSNYDCNYNDIDIDIDNNDNVFISTIMKPINLPSIVQNVDFKGLKYKQF